MKYAVVDVETTGFSVEHDEIVEIAVVSVQGGNIRERWSSLVRPSSEVRLRTIKVHGLDNDTLAAAPRRERLIPRLIDLLHGVVLVEHNLDGFDSRFLSKFLGASPWSSSLNTLAVAKRSIPNLPGYDLGSVAAHFGVRPWAQHQAEADALATAEVLLRLLPWLSPSPEA